MHSLSLSLSPPPQRCKFMNSGLQCVYTLYPKTWHGGDALEKSVCLTSKESTMTSSPSLPENRITVQINLNHALEITCRFSRKNKWKGVTLGDPRCAGSQRQQVEIARKARAVEYPFTLCDFMSAEWPIAGQDNMRQAKRVQRRERVWDLWGDSERRRRTHCTEKRCWVMWQNVDKKYGLI